MSATPSRCWSAMARRCANTCRAVLYSRILSDRTDLVCGCQHHLELGHGEPALVEVADAEQCPQVRRVVEPLRVEAAGLQRPAAVYRRRVAARSGRAWP